jgi:hypothetical protein
MAKAMNIMTTPMIVSPKEPNNTTFTKLTPDFPGRLPFGTKPVIGMPQWGQVTASSPTSPPQSIQLNIVISNRLYGA